jgi:hypothetical protein
MKLVPGDLVRLTSNNPEFLYYSWVLDGIRNDFFVVIELSGEEDNVYPITILHPPTGKRMPCREEEFEVVL